MLSDADLALGRLAGIADVLPNPDLFVAMYVKKEAVLSSQIEGSTFANAAFVPPPDPDMEVALDSLERFLHNRSDMPLAMQCAVVHLQFETIHPFLDGNGRVGRLLVALMFHERGALSSPSSI